MKAMPTPIRLAAIGAGMRFSILHDVLASLPQHFTLTVVADSDPSLLAAATASSPHLQTFTDYTEAVTSPDVDAVLVLTPDWTHATIAMAALGAGKHVFIEKPIATTVADADRLITYASQCGRTLYVGHNMRFMPIVETIKTAIDDGLIGHPQAFMIRHFIGRGGDYFFKDWHCESSRTGGLLIHKASHDLDAMAYILGTTYTSVQAIGANRVYQYGHLRQPSASTPEVKNDIRNWPPHSQTNLNPAMDVEDVSFINLVCANGIIGSYSQCHFTPDYWRNYCIIGDEGRLENFGDTSNGGSVRIWNKRRPGYDAQADIEIPIGMDHGTTSGHDGSDERILDDFYQTIHGGTPRTSSSDARQVVAVGEAARLDILGNRNLSALADRQTRMS
ncbi:MULTISPECIES: Gfo/Idh/MocA family protein [Actinomyces]|uniref:Gfo/Idh/MocA family oxidoreductase n=1 Tax=Actinomyces respiraculi TaxID=2744574 RepID=A0A7T0LN37_9ACTO|nr:MULTISPECIES: Gfo/Idh/MocA family oxidoreductase [Actinomyces]QPL06183.1 Gfo/Idh/MocA family oxidoreductase [Actinomyces respiraculi]